MMSQILLFSIFYAGIKRNPNSQTFSWNIHFEVKYLDNSLADYSDTHIIPWLFHMRATYIFFVVAL